MNRMFFFLAMVMSTVASVQAAGIADFGGSVDAFCDGHGHENAYSNPDFNLKEGRYSSDNENFCDHYNVTASTHYPCNGNISGFTLTCGGTTRSYAFACANGVCKTADGVREIKVDTGCSETAHYRSSDRHTELAYKGPCSIE